MNRKEINNYFEVDDEMLDSMAAEYEQGTWHGKIGPIMAGHPHISDVGQQQSKGFPQSL